MQNMGNSMPYVKYLVIGDKYTPESVFDEDFALVDDDNVDEPEVIPDVGYEPRSTAMPSPTRSAAAVAPDDPFDNDPFNPHIEPVVNRDDAF